MKKKYEVLILPVSEKALFQDDEITLQIRKYGGHGLDILHGLLDGGHIESIDASALFPFLPDANNKLTVYGDDEGKLKRLVPSAILYVKDEKNGKTRLKAYDTVNGSIIVRGFDGVDDDEPLTSDQIAVLHYCLSAVYDAVNVEYENMDTAIEFLSEGLEDIKNDLKREKDQTPNFSRRDGRQVH